MGKITPIEKLILRFNKKYVIDSDTGCWNWTAALNNYGYGNFRVDNKVLKAHRFSYEYYVGEIHQDLVVCHSCDNRKCVNPNHLRQDTQSSNLIDMSYAMTNPSQVLNVEQVKQIKIRLKETYLGQVNDLAHQYNVSQSCISLIKNNKRWSHIQIP
jgi:hypothetical protein